LKVPHFASADLDLHGVPDPGAFNSTSTTLKPLNCPCRHPRPQAIASLRGHLKAEGDEQTGSQSYIPADPKDDKALHTALDLIRGIQKNSAYPPNPKTAVPN
jgi:hypothetical protein